MKNEREERERKNSRINLGLLVTATIVIDTIKLLIPGIERLTGHLH